MATISKQGWAAVAGCLAVCLSLSAGLARAESGGSVYLEEMTSPELRDRMAHGTTIALVPIGGTEQNGPVMTLGKHNARAHALAGLIAKRLGNAVVAPVISYVPEGSIRPPAAHMRFTGTISIPDAAFEGVLEGTARSLIQHGFRAVVFLGDHGGYQKSEERVAAKLSKSGSGLGEAKVLALRTYYEVSQTAYVADLKAKGYSDAEIGTHAGLADASLSLAVDPRSVRQEVLQSGRKWTPADGVYGDPRRASADLGQLGVHRIVESSVETIRQLTGTR
ncbi:MAG TPA: creatininase family protein [Aquabacterium sp.]|nr:creatininase family protein [Aquabacterium sp.]